MKKLLCLLLTVITFSCILCSCDNSAGTGEYVTDIAPEITKTYNEDGLPEQIVYNDDEGNLNRTVYYEYDEHGNITSEKTIKADGTLDTLLKFEYKKIGEDFRETKKTVYLTEDKINYYITDYEYKEINVDGKKEYCVMSYKRYTGDGKLSEVYTYKYDENGSLKSLKTEDANGTLISKTEY